MDIQKKTIADESSAASTDLSAVEPSPPEAASGGRWLSAAPAGEEICITGLAGSYPESDNVHQLRDNLFNGVDMVTAGARWNIGHPLLPERCGRIRNVEKFDAGFFGVHYKQTNVMAPILRHLMEKTYEAIVDAGVNPEQLRGTRTGVFLSSWTAESEPTWMFEDLQPEGLVLTGVVSGSWATRISYWLQVNGPSRVVDTACSGSSYALDHAYQAIRDGRIDQAIVGGCTLLLNPNLSIAFTQMGSMSLKGRSKTFDNGADGYARSEAAVVVFVQRARDAKRVYASVVHSKTNNDGFKTEGIAYPSGNLQQKLLEDFYDECGVDPASVAWLEAHGTGTKVGDPEEVNAATNVFCRNRKTPLPIGSLKTNIGHTEAVSGLCSLSKIVVAMETGLIPANLHYDTPRQGVPGLFDGRLKVITETTPWEGGLVGLSSFGFGGGNSHILLRSHPKEKVNGGAPGDDIPRLVTLSGRTREGVEQMLNDLESRPVDVEHVRLLHDIFSIRTPGHTYRGYTLIHTRKPVRHVQQASNLARPIWLVFSNLQDLNLTRLGKSLMVFPVFAKTIQICSQVLEHKDLDRRDVITTAMVDEQSHVCVAVAAVQIGLVELLRSVGVKPDGVIGDFSGVAGYVAGRTTIEETILMAYQRGRILDRLNREDQQDVDQEDCIETPTTFPTQLNNVSYTNGGHSYEPFPSTETNIECTKVMKKHSRHNAEGRLLHNRIQLVVTECPCESLPTNNIGMPVSLEEAKGMIPRHAILLEISSDESSIETLSRLKKRTTCLTIADTKDFSVEQFLNKLGMLYEYGVDLQLANLYPSVAYPVSRGTPMISPLIGWNHSQDWFVFSLARYYTFTARESYFEIDVSYTDFTFYTGHVVDGRNLFPATGYLTMVWEVLASMKGLNYTETPAVFEDIRFLRATSLPKKGRMTFIVMIQKVSGRFEVVESGEAVVTGAVRIPEDVAKEALRTPPPEQPGGGDIPPASDAVQLSAKDVYKELRLRGYQYKGIFKSILSADPVGRTAKILWQNNWVAFVDNILQTQILSQDTRGLFVPTSIGRLSIDTRQHRAMLDLHGPEFQVSSQPEVGLVWCGGVECRDVGVSVISRRRPRAEPVLDKYVFVPNTDATLDLEQALQVCIHVALENQPTVRVKVVELVDGETDPDKQLLAPVVAAILGHLPLIQAEIRVLSKRDNPRTKDLGPNIKVEDTKLSAEENCLLVVGTNILERKDVLDAFFRCTKNRGFLISREKLSQVGCSSDIEVLNEYVVGEERIVLARKSVELPDQCIIHIESGNFDWLPKLQAALKALKKRDSKRIVLVSQGEPQNGIQGLFNCVRKEEGGLNTRCVSIQDPTASDFDPALPLYRDQLAKNLACNVYRDGQWGSYQHLPLDGSTTLDAPHAYVNVTIRGDLSSLRWLEGPIDPLRFKPGPNEQLFHVYYASLNFRDVMLASGRLAAEVMLKDRLSQDCVLGFEFVGRDSRGKRVMGITSAKCLSTLVVGDTELVWDIPDEWTMEDAATVPVTYATALYALVASGRMVRGDRVLIHAGSGGVGQAAITVALLAGCTVFTTVGTQEKREFIKERFPQLTDRHIGSSRDTSFELLVIEETGGSGVDIVLNCLTGDLLRASLRCLAVGGRFLEIGKVDMIKDTLIDVATLSRGISVHGILLDLFNASSTLKKALHSLLKTGIEGGVVKPLTRTVFPGHDIEKAFRYMASGKHIGKVLLQIRSEEVEKTVIPDIKSWRALPRVSCTSHNTYIIIGGLGGFGLELADWLVLRGARRLVLTSRTGIRTGYQSSRVRTWRSYGVTVKISTDDVTKEDGTTRLLREASELGEVEGIFNLAVVLADALLGNQTAEKFTESFAPKVTATHNLDRLSRRLCPHLKHFVVFSSVSCGRGNVGQTNYGMANSVMEQVCEQRVAVGLPGLAVQWGAVGDVGLVADMLEEHKELVIGGTLQQSITSCLQVLDRLLKQPHPVVSSMVVAEKRAGGGGSLVDYVANMLGIRDVKSVSEHLTLAELGIDSLLVVEMKQALEQEYDVFLSPKEIRTLTFDKLAKMADMGFPETKQKNSYDWNIVAFQFLRRALEDEASASLPTIALPSLATEKAEEKLFMVPGVEGMASIFEPLARMLTYRVTGLQLVNKGGDVTRDTIQGMAEALLLHIKSHLAPNEPFNLLGYSFGGVVALQLALLLENEGHRGRLFLLDSSPEFFRSVLANQLEEDAQNESLLQTNFLAGLLTYLKAEELQTVHEQNQIRLYKLGTWEDRVDLFLSLLPDGAEYSRSYARSIVTAIWNRVKAVLCIETAVTRKLTSDVTLIRPQYKGVEIDLDYGLGKYCEQTVEVHMVEGDHASIIESSEVASIINRGVTDLHRELHDHMQREHSSQLGRNR